MKVLVRVLLSLALCLLLWHGSPPSVDALGPKHTKRFVFQLRYIIKKHPQYKWGGASDETGLDCSHYVWLAGKRAGFDVRYAVSKDMARGHGGWRGWDITLREARAGDLIWWTWRSRPDRVNGHVGALIRDKDSFPAVTHASSKRGVVVDSLHGVLLRDISKVRRLAFGEKRTK